MGSEAFVASGDKEKAERVSRNERPKAATIEAADAARRRETSPFGKEIILSENSIILIKKRQIAAFLTEHGADAPSHGNVRSAFAYSSTRKA